MRCASAAARKIDESRLTAWPMRERRCLEAGQPMWDFLTGYGSGWSLLVEEIRMQDRQIRRRRCIAIK